MSMWMLAAIKGSATAASIAPGESKADPDDAITGPIRAMATSPPVPAPICQDFRPHMHILVNCGTADERNDGAAHT
jgi:hypothetical protein